MKIESYKTPKSSFLSMDKDLSIIISWILKNKNLKKLLYYTNKDPLSENPLNEEEEATLLEKNIVIVPSFEINNEVLNRLVIGFDNFIPNDTNPEFRNNYVYFDIICHFNQWQLPDLQLRPYRIAAEIDSMFDKKHLSGIGVLEFITCEYFPINDEFAGLTLVYQAVHGEEDKKNTLNPVNQKQIIDNFNELFND